MTHDEVNSPHGTGIPDPSAPTVAEEVADLLHATARRLRHAAHHGQGEDALPGAQWRALRMIAWCDTPPRMSAIAERLGIARRSATGVVDELEARGLVSRADDPGDRRSVVVAVTPDGRRVLAEAGARRRRAMARQLAPLSPEDLATLGDLLRRLQDHPPA